MGKNNVYIYYSGATDVTGKKLQEGLGITGGNKKPTKKSLQMVIGWGAKTKEKVTFPKGVKVLNHPDAIKHNRNKFEALKTMAAVLNKNGAQHIPTLVSAEEVKARIADGTVNYPLIGRKKYHQGGKGFWECPTVAQLDAAINAGAHHFQPIVAVKDEYRLHVFDSKVIHAVKKVQRTEDDFKAAFIEDELNRQKTLWEKNNTGAFNEDQAREMLRRQADNAVAGGPNMLLRSNKLGWKFSIVKKYPEALVTVAAKAVEALGLDFGAVDCCVDVDGNPWIFEVNSGPGLEATSLEKYLAAFEDAIGEKKTAAKKPAAKKETKKTTTKTSSSKKEFLSMQLGRLQEMIDDADEDDVEKLEELGRKLIFGGQ